MVTCKTCRRSMTYERWRLHKICEDCIVIRSVEDAIEGVHLPHTKTSIALPFPDSRFVVEVDRPGDLRSGDSVQIDRWIFYVLDINHSGIGTYNLSLASSHQIPIVIDRGAVVINLRKK